ncbi:uncharacterized protein IL334_002986 [Kwoniella shivajii]|uniref:Peptidase C19 ubiquitin carboxyl-terminal hydrolase domain-containing protein n=1 Tax=Kwoniella shivajii TaxID=564305 RepID=A0ABZ1CXZ3_9TREE|nr:hypothetical protein IL334_002986 [Kwoniella shivajii]
MSVHDITFNALKEMGIDPIIAREAASRFHNVEPAVNWCFGDGSDWKPEPPKPEGPPIYDSWRPQRAEGTSVEHREVIDVDTPSSGEPTPSANPQFASNNPFRQDQARPPPLPHRNIAPARSLAPTIVGDDDDDEDLRKALSMSVAEIGEPIEEDDKRLERERSVRATGPPPPSPTNDEGEVTDTLLGPLFGPTNKTDEEGKMALVPASHNNNTTSTSKEDEDMDRAIQESLMTASLHSNSAVKDVNKAVPTERVAGAPLVLYSETGHSTYAANFLQAMYAVPQLRDAVANVLASNQIMEAADKGKVFVDLYKSSIESKSSFVEVDDPLKELRDGKEPNQLPPNYPALELHKLFVHYFSNLMLSQVGDASSPEHWQALDTLGPERMFQTHVDGDHPQRSSYVTFNRGFNTPPDIYSHLANVLWQSDSASQSLVDLGDILTVILDWTPAATREVWKLDERVVLDRFMKSNAAYAAQKRALQSVMAGNARRTQEKIDHLTTHEGNDYQQSIATLIEHLDNSPLTEDKLQNESQREMKDKLERILKFLQQGVSDLKEELKGHSEASSGTMFETDDPAYNQHVYILRGILFQDGALVGGKHLYAYIKGEDGRWWKVQEYQIEPIEWESIVTDKTGLWMDGGAYMLIYSRDGPRPPPPAPSPAPSHSQLERQLSHQEASPAKSIQAESLPHISPHVNDLMDISMTNPSTTSTRQGSPEANQIDVDMRSAATLTGESEDGRIEDKETKGDLINL